MGTRADLHAKLNEFIWIKYFDISTNNLVAILTDMNKIPRGGYTYSTKIFEIGLILNVWFEVISSQVKYFSKVKKRKL